MKSEGLNRWGSASPWIHAPLVLSSRGLKGAHSSTMLCPPPSPLSRTKDRKRMKRKEAQRAGMRWERKIRSWFDLQSICLWCWCSSSSSRSRHRHYQQTEGSPVLSTALVSSASTSFTPERTAEADPLFWKHLWSNDKTDMKQKWVCHLWFSVISEHLGRNAASLFKADKPIV